MNVGEKSVHTLGMNNGISLHSVVAVVVGLRCEYYTEVLLFESKFRFSSIAQSHVRKRARRLFKHT